MYKLVVSDLDGTFLDDERKIPEKNIQAVRLMEEKGVMFALASGRSYHSLDGFYDALSLKGKGVCGIAFNGACVYEIDTLKKIKTVLLDNAKMQTLTGMMRPFLKDIYVYGEDGTLYCEYETDTFTGYRTRSRVPGELRDLREIKDGVVKILLIDKYEVLSAVYERLVDYVPGVCNMFFSSKTMLEFTELSATKGAALKTLCERLGVDISETIAVGDNYNDESMVLAAGLGAVTANAEEELKEKARYITGASNNDGALMEIAETFL